MRRLIMASGSSTYRFRVLALLLGAALAVGLSALVGTKPAEAAFPGDNGKIAFASNRTTGTGVDNPEGDREIFTMNPDGSDLTQLTFNTADDSQPAWSADGAKIAFTSFQDNNYEIYVMDTDPATDDAINLTKKNPAPDLEPVWSPNGTKIAFTSFRDGNFDLYKMNADGSSQLRLTKNPEADRFPAWSADGTKIAFTSNRDGNEEIYKMKPKPESRKNRPINLSRSPAEDSFPNWSADGKQIAFQTDRGFGGDDEIYKMNVDGTGATPLTENGALDFEPAWSPDSTKIAIWSLRDGNSEIYTMNSDGSNQTNITNNPASDSVPDWQPTS